MNAERLGWILEVGLLPFIRDKFHTTIIYIMTTTPNMPVITLRTPQETI